MAQNTKKTIITSKQPLSKPKVQPVVHKAKAAVERKTFEFAFGKENYKLLLIGLAVLALGYILMIGGGSDDPKVFSDKIFDFQRLTLAPIVLIIGFIIEVFAIMVKPKE